ncbi:hypothetical protein [Aquimarina agarilytica]|uniref:hypothetical protein n=1 Tax=Aquimarina agarilytica TaxID=1087449 RepID=UPI000287D0DF|nr:hypothetical protein [Aquimarina agarilytica]
MKEKIAYVVLVITALLSCVLVWKHMLYESIFVRFLSLISIGYVYYLYKGTRQKLFYIALFIVAIGESLVVLGMQNYQLEIMFAFTTYYWLIFFLLKKNTRNINFWSKRKLYIPSLITTVFLIYLTYVALSMVNEGYNDKVYKMLIPVGSFLILVMYMGLIYMDKRTVRNFWLLPAIASFILVQFLLPIEAFYYNSIYIKCLGFLIQIARHFFILKFLISTEDDVIGGYNKSYL